MSTIKVNKIENTSTTNGGVSIDNDGHVTIDGQQLPTAGPLSNRNMIINGAMQVWQRSTSSGVNGYTSVDRFKYSISNGAFNNEKIDVTGGEPFAEGFRTAYRMTNTTTGTAGNSYRLIEHYVEGNVVNSSGWNWASASGNMTLSFWVRSSVDQDFMCYLNTESGTTKSFPVPFSCVANTWTKVTKTIPGDTGITVPNTNARGIAIVWAPYWGTDYTTAAGPTLDQWNNWDGGNRAIDYGSGWGTTTNATFDLTGIQLEVGSKATPFEHRSYGDEELRCMRYYQRFGETIPNGAGQDDGFMTFANYTGTNAYGGQKFTVPMRSRPTMVAAGCAYYSNGSTDNSISVDMIGASTNYGELRISGFSFTGGHAGWLRIEGGGAYIEFNAEL